MKTTLLHVLVCAGMASVSVHGQTVIVVGAVGCAPVPAPACPVGACPAVAAPTAVCRVPLAPCGYASPNVIYVGAGRGDPQPNYYSGCGYSVRSCGWAYASPNVIPFGAGQAYVQGYHFQHSR